MLVALCSSLTLVPELRKRKQLNYYWAKSRNRVFGVCFLILPNKNNRKKTSSDFFPFLIAPLRTSHAVKLPYLSGNRSRCHLFPANQSYSASDLANESACQLAIPVSSNRQTRVASHGKIFNQHISPSLVDDASSWRTAYYHHHRVGSIQTALALCCHYCCSTRPTSQTAGGVVGQ